MAQKDKYKYVKEYSPEILKGIGFLMFIYFLIWLFQPKSAIEFSALMTSLTLGFFTYKKLPLKDIIKGLIKTFIYIYIFYTVIHWLGKFGTLGVIIIIVGIALWRVIKNRVMYMEAIRTIETMLYGKTLDKELKKVKVKNGKKKTSK